MAFIGGFCIYEGFLFVNDYIAPLFLNSRLERLHETGLPKAWIENGSLHCRMKADDFCLPLPYGYRALAPRITSGGFDTVDGVVELRRDNSAKGAAGSEFRNVQIGGDVQVEQTLEGIIIHFHYFGDK